MAKFLSPEFLIFKIFVTSSPASPTIDLPGSTMSFRPVGEIISTNLSKNDSLLIDFSSLYVIPKPPPTSMCDKFIFISFSA